MKNLIILSLIIIQPLTNLQAQSKLTGTWEAKFMNDANSMELLFKITEEEGYTLDMNKDGSVEVSGNWKIEGEQIQFEDSGGPMACRSSEGVYTYQLNGDTLNLTLVQDDCPGRKRMMPSVTWKRISEP